MSDPVSALESAPLVRAWREFVDRGQVPFTIPAHKRRAGLLSPTLGRMLDADVPLYGGLDTVKLTGGTLAEAEAAAAELWGAGWARISTGGSTHGNQVMLLAVGRPGDRVLVSRTAHRSTLLGLVLAGLTPVWLPVDLDPKWGLPTGVGPDTLRETLSLHPDAVAVVLVEPAYVGTVAPLGELAPICHDAGVPLVVDQAWGAHLGFHPAYPPHALAQGADAMVISAHKTLPAFSQAALVLMRPERLDPARWNRAFDACHTTSPAGAILASADGARALLAHPAGSAMLGRLADTLRAARERLRHSGYLVPGPEDFPAGRFDPLKLVVRTDALGLSGVLLEDALIRTGLPVEMADRDLLIPAIGLLDDVGTVGRLVEALVEFARAPGSFRTEGASGPTGTGWAATAQPSPTAALTPREAFFADHESVEADAAVGRVCAEVVAPYPPGIPVLVPGERITEATLGHLRAAQAAGTRIAYAADATLRTLQVVRAGPR